MSLSDILSIKTTSSEVNWAKLSINQLMCNNMVRNVNLYNITSNTILASQILFGVLYVAYPTGSLNLIFDTAPNIYNAFTAALGQPPPIGTDVTFDLLIHSDYVGTLSFNSSQPTGITLDVTTQNIGGPITGYHKVHVVVTGVNTFSILY